MGSSAGAANTSRINVKTEAQDTTIEEDQHQQEPDNDDFDDYEEGAEEGAYGGAEGAEGFDDDPGEGTSGGGGGANYDDDKDNTMNSDTLDRVEDSGEVAREYPKSLKMSQQGKLMIVDQDGYEYVKDYEVAKEGLPLKTYWKCKKFKQCKARMNTLGNEYLIKKTKLHQCNLPW